MAADFAQADLPYGARASMEPVRLELDIQDADGSEQVTACYSLSGIAEHATAQFEISNNSGLWHEKGAPDGVVPVVKGSDQVFSKGESPVAAVQSAESVPQPRFFAEKEEDSDGECGEPAEKRGVVEVSRAGEVLEVAVKATCPVRMKGVRVVLRHAFATDEQVLLNGYQSWTDTWERPAWERMRGLRGVPRAVVDRWALAGDGDYALVDYSARRGEQHGFTYGTFRRGEGMVLVGSLDESHGFTLIRTFAARGEVVLETECPARELAAGERVTLGCYAIVRGREADCYDCWFQLAGVQARPAPPLVGYTSWYRHYGDIDEERLLHDLSGMGRVDRETAHPQMGAAALEVPPSETAPLETAALPQAGTAALGAPLHLFQIDDGYCKVGDWLEVDARKFPHGLAPLAQQIEQAGQVPGLWVAPFVCERDSRVFRECGEWLLRDDAGEPIATGPQWSGGYALDTRNVEVRSYILDVLHTMAHEWGFRLLKADFLFAACMRPHDGLNAGELMADAMELLRRGAGEDTLILGCGVPLASAFGRVEYCRIGCDVGLDWNDRLYMRLLHRERVSTKNSLANTYGRSPLDGRAFGNDPDVFFLRDDVKLTQAQRDELLFADADLGSVFLTSDDRGAWTDAMRARYDEALRVFLGRHRRRAEAAGRSGGADAGGGRAVRDGRA